MTPSVGAIVRYVGKAYAPSMTYPPPASTPLVNVVRPAIVIEVGDDGDLALGVFAGEYFTRNPVAYDGSDSPAYDTWHWPPGA